MLEVRASHTLTHSDYKNFIPIVEKLIKKHGKIRLLFEMADFHGWSGTALWDDIKFDFKHFGDIDRLAMVGENTWEKGMSMFCKPFTSAEIRYFEKSRIEEARSWLQRD